MSRSSEFRIWAGMLQRCTDHNSRAFHHYGGRGIKVCDRWLESFEAFYADMGPRPDGLTLDRIDNDGDYTPENCRWATKAEQSLNRRTNHRVEFSGRNLTVSQWSRETGLDGSLIRIRLKNGWTAEEALTVKPDRGQCLHGKRTGKPSKGDSKATTIYLEEMP